MKYLSIAASHVPPRACFSIICLWVWKKLIRTLSPYFGFCIGNTWFGICHLLGYFCWVLALYIFFTFKVYNVWFVLPPHATFTYVCESKAFLLELFAWLIAWGKIWDPRNKLGGWLLMINSLMAYSGQTLWLIKDNPYSGQTRQYLLTCE